MKKPPPFVPSSLIASCEATGPSGTVCVAPSSVVTFAEAEKLWTTPCDIRTTAARREIGRRTKSVARVRSTWKWPRVFASARAIPRITATATAIPVAAERKFWRASAAICVRCDIVASPAYACQFVFVTNETAVFQARAGGTAWRRSGFSGRRCWSRSNA